MSGLSGKPGLTASAPISNDGFWPDLLIGDLLQNYRIPPEYADGVIKTGLTLAMIRINQRLAEVKQAIVLLGHSNLADYTLANSQQIAGVEVLLTEYQNAVFTRAKAGLLQQFNSLNRKENAENAAKESPKTEQYWLDESQSSIKVFFDELIPDNNEMSNSNVQVAML